VRLGREGKLDRTVGGLGVIAQQGEPGLPQVGRNQLAILMQSLCVQLSGIGRLAEPEQGLAAPCQDRGRVGVGLQFVEYSLVCTLGQHGRYQQGQYLFPRLAQRQGPAQFLFSRSGIALRQVQLAEHAAR